MTIPVSSLRAAKANLKSKITTQINDSTVLISYDHPGPNLPDDIVCVGNVTRQLTAGAQMVGGGGAGYMDELYMVDVIVSVFRGGDDAQTTFERACALAEAVETAVRSDLTLGGVNGYTAQQGPVHTAYPFVAQYVGTWAPSDDEEEGAGGRLCEITLQIACKFRI